MVEERRGEKEAEGVMKAKKYEGDEEGRNYDGGEREGGNGWRDSCGKENMSLLLVWTYGLKYTKITYCTSNQISREHSNYTNKMH